MDQRKSVFLNELSLKSSKREDAQKEDKLERLRSACNKQIPDVFQTVASLISKLSDKIDESEINFAVRSQSNIVLHTTTTGESINSTTDILDTEYDDDQEFMVRRLSKNYTMIDDSYQFNESLRNEIQQIEDFIQRWKENIKNKEFYFIIRFIVSEIKRYIPIEERRQINMNNDSSIVNYLIRKTSKMLNNDFLTVDFHSSTAIHDLNSIDWQTMIKCHHSESGQYGVYFIQFEDNSIIVCKPSTINDIERLQLVNQIAQELSIICPNLRAVTKQTKEYDSIHCYVKKLFQPYDEITGSFVYELGEHESAMNLFSDNYSHILLLEFVTGKTLTHRNLGQRELNEIDYFSMGKLFFLDLLIKNKDRFPNRKAFGARNITTEYDHHIIQNNNMSPNSSRGLLFNVEKELGNPGNVMFGNTPGELYAIDSEMNIPMIDSQQEDYIKTVKSIVLEFIKNDPIYHNNNKANKLRREINQKLMMIHGLFFHPFSGCSELFDGMSLEKLSPWPYYPYYNYNDDNDNNYNNINNNNNNNNNSNNNNNNNNNNTNNNNNNEMKYEALVPLLDIIRSISQSIMMIFKNEENKLFLNSYFNFSSPPAYAIETEWRFWIRDVIPRTTFDIIDFMENTTGWKAPSNAKKEFEHGFLKSLLSSFEMFDKHKISLNSETNTNDQIIFMERLINRLKEWEGAIQLE
eukprot:gene15185-20455_t